jgi:hypothetical protein
VRTPDTLTGPTVSPAAKVSATATPPAEQQPAAQSAPSKTAKKPAGESSPASGATSQAVPQK